MTCHASIALIVLFIIALACSSIPWHLLFREYCERIAILERRTDEFYKLSADDGFSEFETEHLGKIRSGYYLKFDDEQLTKLGSKLSKRRWRVSFFLIGFCLLIAIIYSNSYACSA